MKWFLYTKSYINQELGTTIWLQYQLSSSWGTPDSCISNLTRFCSPPSVDIIFEGDISSFCLLLWQVWRRWYLKVSIFLYTSWQTSHLIFSLGAWIVLRCLTTTCFRSLDLPHDAQSQSSPCLTINCSTSLILALALVNKISNSAAAEFKPEIIMLFFWIVYSSCLFTNYRRRRLNAFLVSRQIFPPITNSFLIL